MLKVHSQKSLFIIIIKRKCVETKHSEFLIHWKFMVPT